MSDFTMKAWRDYALQHVVAETDEQKARKSRLLGLNLLTNRLESVWRNLARDVKPLTFTNEDGSTYVIDWKEALHQVIGTLIFPPDIIDPTPYSSAAKAAHDLRDSLIKMHWNPDALDDALRACQIGQTPLMPGKSAGRDFDRNWLALYLRERVIRPFFNGPHHADIAALVSAALEVEITADQVRLLKSRNNDRP